MKEDIGLNSILVQSESVVTREIDGSVLIFPLVSGIGHSEDEIYTLNEAGQAIWKNLDGNKTLSQVSQILSRTYSASLNELENDVLSFSNEMLKRGMLKVKK